MEKKIKIKSIEVVGNSSKLYDIEVKDNNNFYANGILVHNCQSATFTGKMIPNDFPIIGKLLFKKFKFIVCSRNLTTNDKGNLYWKIAKKYNLEQILKENPTLKNYHYNYLEMWEFCEKYKLNIVPLLASNSRMIADYSEIPTKFAVEYKYKLSQIGSTVQELVEFSKAKSVINPNVEREGIVVRCIENGIKLLSFKVINPDFLLKYFT